MIVEAFRSDNTVQAPNKYHEHFLWTWASNKVLFIYLCFSGEEPWELAFTVDYKKYS